MEIIEEGGENILISTKSFDPGEDVLEIFMDPSSQILAHRNKHTIEMREKMHVLHPLGKYMHHSCEPNLYLRKSKGVFVSLKPIREGDALTFNYLKNETKISNPFTCQCESEFCQQEIR